MRPLERFFFKYGELLARHPWPFIIVPTIITLISTYGFTFFHSQDDIWDIYAPLNGASRVEEKGLQRFEYASGSHHYRMQVLVSRKDGASLLHVPTLKEVGDTQKFVTDNLTISDGTTFLRYMDVCGIYCNESNGAVIAFLTTLLETQSTQLQLSFPNAQAFNNEVFLGYSIGNLTIDGNGLVQEARLLILHYMVDLSLPNGQIIAEDFEYQLRNLFEERTQTSENVSYALLSRARELEEQRAITIASLPALGLTIIVLTMFMLITMVDFPLYRSQHIESLLGVLSPGMALWTSAGILFWLGFPFSNILTVVPFLVVTIGIDDAFLILAGWRHSTQGASLEQRMGESVAISGASVTVTSVTDVLCFAIGLISNMPVVQLFCLYVTVALFIDFFYQMTFFTAFVGIIGKRKIAIDELGKDSGMSSETSSIQKWKSKLLESNMFTVAFEKAKEAKKQEEEVTGVEKFVKWLHTTTAKTLIMGVFLTHIGISAFLATKVNTDFDMENLYLHDSPLTDISRRMQDFLLKESFIVNFAVHPMPHFENETTRQRFEKMLSRLESIPIFGAGPDHTTCWTRKYKDAVQFWGEEEDMYNPESLLTNYREYDLSEKFITINKTSDGEEFMDGFFFMIVYHNMSSFLEVEKMMELRRGILAEYPEFSVLSHHPFEKVPTESAAAAPSNFLQTAVSAVVMMSVLVLLFVMELEAIISVVISIVSICVGIIGYLHLWDVHLDAVSLISILMSIGFSVDYSAHVCYHYFAHAAEEEKESPHMHRVVVNGTADLTPSPKTIDTQARIVSTLNGVGWPVIQSGLSTIIGMFPLMFVNAYVVAVFWKTVILVGILGIFHALLLLPILFIITAQLRGFFRRRIDSVSPA